MTLLDVLDQSGGPMCEAAAARIRELEAALRWNTRNWAYNHGDGWQTKDGVPMPPEIAITMLEFTAETKAEPKLTPVPMYYACPKCYSHHAEGVECPTANRGVKS